MGFNKVYKSLQELFPQIDARALRAVSIEHSKDVDAAVEAVLEEFIPFFTEKSRSSSPLTVSISASQLSNDDGKPSHDANNGNNEPLYDTYTGQPQGEGDNAELMSENFVETGTNIVANVQSSETAALTTDSSVNIHQSKVYVDPESKRNISADICLEDRMKNSSDKISSHTIETLEDVDMCANHIMNLVQEKEDFDAQTVDKENTLGKSSTQSNTSADERSLVTVQTLAVSPSQSSNQLVVETSYGIVGNEDECTMNDYVTQSNQINIMSVLEESIAEARNNKKTLLSAIESVISMNMEVELREEAAERAKEESTKGITHVLDNVEELKRMLKHAKEANEMHAGEIYGEKAILATELKELQSRVIFLSEERDKSLAILDEMRNTLELRLATAENEVRCAEQEMLRKQNSTRKALADQEMIMDSVVQESNILKQQSEENSKLREFLVDRGCVVDVLQGEIAVICQDVKLLKEKFDECVPLSKSISSSQTSCMLASSSSSFKSFIPDQVEPLPSQDDLINFKQNTDQVTVLSVDEAAIHDRKALLEEGWEFFDNL